MSTLTRRKLRYHYTVHDVRFVCPKCRWAGDSYMGGGGQYDRAERLAARDRDSHICEVKEA